MNVHVVAKTLNKWQKLQCRNHQVHICSALYIQSEVSVAARISILPTMVHEALQRRKGC